MQFSDLQAFYRGAGFADDPAADFARGMERATVETLIIGKLRQCAIEATAAGLNLDEVARKAIEQHLEQKRKRSA